MSSLPSVSATASGRFTMNFYDDPTHVNPVDIGALAQRVGNAGLAVETSGTSRNWLFAAAWPAFALLPPSRKKFTARAHWLGWSAFAFEFLRWL